MMFLLLSVLLFTHFSFCSSQDFAEDNSYDVAGNCSNLDESAICITNYSQLDSYVLNNQDLLRTFTETFFRTGESASEIVKLTYNFNVLNRRSNSSHDLIICTSHQTSYIWSTSPLYLLGAKPLRWQTIFAVNVPQASVIIDLPCFSTDAYADLLARLTYLVRVASHI